MSFIPHTPEDVRQMLGELDIQSIDALFDEVPPELLVRDLPGLAPAMNEMEMLRHMGDRASANFGGLCFMGAGAYEHHIPSAVWDIAARGEFMTAYTPYQAEASQGTLQLVYEYQSMMTALMGMDVSNASLYDGASALAEAVLMAVRGNRKDKTRRILVAGTLNPRYLRATRAIVEPQGITLEALPASDNLCLANISEYEKQASEGFCALVIPMPNFFGQIEDVHGLTDWAHSHQALVIGVVNPVAVNLLVPPGQWGQTGADIAVGDGQPLGLPLASGGPYFGFMCCRQALVRQMPGRLIGKTVDSEGREGYALTLQAREQHIRRAKATSNICTNQGLAVTAATIHMALMGASGLQSVAQSCFAGAHQLSQQLESLPGVERLGGAAYFHEFVIRLPVAPGKVIDEMVSRGILPGYDLGEFFPDLGNALLVCVTDMRSPADIAQYVTALSETLKNLEGAQSC